MAFFSWYPWDQTDTFYCEGEVPPEPTNCTEGCDYLGNCLDYGFRMKVGNDTSSYCSFSSRSFVAQKPVDSSCDDHYQCLSNQCSDGVCVGLVEEIRAQTNLLWTILCTLVHPINGENRCECIAGDNSSAVYFECLA